MRRRTGAPRARMLATAAAGAIALAPAPAGAQGVAPQPLRPGLTLSGTGRVRVETINGQARTGANSADTLLNLRSTVMAQYRDGPIRLVGELWDSRVYGDRPGTPISTGEVNALELVQAFAEVTAPGLLGAGSTATILAGRSMMNLGSRRLVAADDYRNTTSGYTGLRADLSWGQAGGKSGAQAKSGVWAATLIYTLPQQRRPDDLPGLRRNAVAVDYEGFDLVLWGGLVSRARAIGPVMAEVSFFHLGERDRPGRPTRDRSLNTAALRLFRAPATDRIDGELEVIGQRGHAAASTAATAPRQAVRAWFVHADAGYTFADPWKTHLSIEYDHASGDEPGGAYGRFDTLYGMRRADLAPSGLYNAIIRSNIISPGVRLETIPDQRTDAIASLRPMWSAATGDPFSFTGVRDPSGRAGRFAGTQFDGRVRRFVTPWLRLEVDAVLLAKGRLLRAAPNAPPGRWTRYLSLNAAATF